MADILTQLQTCLDQLATQFYATLGYLTTYHDNSPSTPPPNDPSAAPALAKIPKNSTAPPVPASAPSQASPVAPATTPGPGPSSGGAPGEGGAGTTTPGGGGGGGGPIDPTLPPEPDSPRTFAARQRELARDLVIKEQQIEYLISVLPGIDSSEEEQDRRIRELEKELRGVEEERARKVKELRGLRRRLQGVLGGLEVGVYGDRELALASSRTS